LMNVVAHQPWLNGERWTCVSTSSSKHASGKDAL
jgi:hypothetical protein